MIKVVIINPKIREIKDFLNILSFKNPEIKIVGIAQNQKDFIKIKNTIFFDFVIVDLSYEKFKFSYIKDYLHIYNFIFLINNSQNLDKSQKNEFTNFEYIIKNDNEKNINSIISIVSKYTFDNSLKENQILSKIKNELLFLGYDFNHYGTQYLLDTILYIHKSPNLNSYNLKKDIYPFISKKYKKTPNNIKCSIRNATELMYYNNEEEKIKKYFNSFYNFKKPTTRLVISAILNKI